MSGARDLRSLVAQNGHLSVKAGRRQNRNELTTNGVFAGLVTSSSLLAISHNAASVSTAWSISPSTKLHTLFSTLVRVFCRRVLHPNERELFDVYFSDLIISASLVSMWWGLAMHLAHWNANLLNDSSTMSQFAS